MTDKDIILKMLDKRNIKYTENKANNVIQIEAGYVGFFSIFSFNEKNELQSVESYES